MGDRDMSWVPQNGHTLGGDSDGPSRAVGNCWDAKASQGHVAMCSVLRTNAVAMSCHLSKKNRSQCK